MATLGAKKFGGNSSLDIREMIGDERRKQSEDRQIKSRSMREYAELIPESHGPVSIARFPFQGESLYSDEIADAEEVVYMKSTQVGASTAMWRWSVRRVDQFGETVIYFFPTLTHVTEFNDERIDPAINRSPHLQRRITAGSVRKKTLKNIGAGNLVMRGLESKAAVQSVAAQAIVFDEYDDSNSDNIKQAEHRLDNAASLGMKPRIRRLGRPSIPGYGIDAQWQQSDQRRWFVTCPDCHFEQPIDWETNVVWKTGYAGDRLLRPGHDDYELDRDVEQVWRVCARCEASLEGEPILKGRWQATKTGPGRMPGYHLQRLIVPKTDLSKLVIESRATRMSDVETFFNAGLGIAWAATDARLTDEDLNRACGLGIENMLPAYDGQNPTTCGIDVASERDLSMRVSEILPSGHRRALWLGEPEDFDEVVELINRFRISVGTVDSMPERRSARGLAREFPGRIYPVIYDESPTADAWKYDEKKNLIHVNRTEAIDGMMDSIRGLENLPPQRPPTNYYPQMKALVRRVEEGAGGKPRRVYVTTGQHGDDFAHAEVYDLVAQEMLTALQITRNELASQEEQLLTEPPPDEYPNMGYDNVDYDPGFGGID